MERAVQRLNEAGMERSSITRRGGRFLAGGALGALMLAAATGRAALISPISASDVPVSNPASVFDASQAGNTYALAPGTTYIPEGFDTRDLFGGSFGTYSAELNDVIFNDGQPIGTVESVQVTLGSPVSLSGFNLFLEDDGSNGGRSASEFELFANGQLIDDVPILDSTGLESYTGVYGSNCIDVSDVLTGLPAASNYTLEFIQNQGGSTSSGVRALEFEATGSSSSVPEPVSMAGMILAGFALCARRKRMPS